MARFIKAGILLLVMSAPAWGHDWYDAYCCNKKDCHPEQGSVVPEKEGYFVERLGERVPYGSKKVKRSQDNKFHICEYASTVDGSMIRCLYVPGGDV